jgi:hypothetical protein
VVAAYALDGDDRTGAEQFRRARDCGASLAALCRFRDQAVLRPAGPARNRLGVKPPVPDIAVFGVARGAEGPRRHRRTVAVVGKGPHQREARSAIRAGDIGVLEAPRPRIAHLLQTLVACGQVGTHPGAWRSASHALADEKAIRSRSLRVRGLHGDDTGARRRLGPDPVREGINRGRPPFDVDLDTSIVVADPPGEPMCRRQTGHERTETDALDGAANEELAGLDHSGRRSASRQSSIT